MHEKAWQVARHSLSACYAHEENVLSLTVPRHYVTSPFRAVNVLRCHVSERFMLALQLHAFDMLWFNTLVMSQSKQETHAFALQPAQSSDVFAAKVRLFSL